MGDLISYLAHQGIVRVLSVPVIMAVVLYAVYLMAAPPADLDEDGGAAKHS